MSGSDLGGKVSAGDSAGSNKLPKHLLNQLVHNIQ